jgi:hypothetical protein
MPHHQNAGTIHDTNIANKSFGNVAQLKCLGIIVLDQNLVWKEIKRRLNSGNACYHSVQNILPSHLMYKNVKIGIHEANFALSVYWCETWSLALREEIRLKGFLNMVLRKIFGLEKDKVIGGRRVLHNKQLHYLHSSPRIIRMIKSRKMKWIQHIA